MSPLDPIPAPLDRAAFVEHRAGEPRLERLAAIIEGYGPTITAFSGGVDSTLVAAVSAAVHGERALAVTGISASLAAAERSHAAQLAARLGIAHRQVDTHEMRREGYRANAGDRCYHCKSELFEVLQALAVAEGFEAVASGDNLDDVAPGQHRPGMQAAAEQGVRKPLIEARLGKADIRALADRLGLPNAHKPAAPCLASRVPHGTAVDPEILARIDRAESGIRALGFPILRVRHHDDVARVEIPGAELARAVEQRHAIVAACKRAGYRWATLDLAGFRSGSLNVLLSGGDR